MSKVLVIGIDGFDIKLAKKYGNFLPNIHKLMQEGDLFKYNSIFPYDSIPNWSSIYTGVTPAKHGILGGNVENVFKQTVKNTNNLVGKTFWDYASEAGKKVCVINPFVAYPPWKVNGIMASGPVDTNSGNPLSEPEEISRKYSLPPMGGVHQHYPAIKDLDKFLMKSKKFTLLQSDFALDVLKNNDWDLGFFCNTTLDGIEHFFWRYQDEEDPAYIPNNKYESIIQDFYLYIDGIIGNFMKLSYDTLIILSDHGHGMRNIFIVNINEILKDMSLICFNDKSKSLNITMEILNPLKKLLFKFVNNFNLDDTALKCAQIFPDLTKQISKSDHCINKMKSIAYTSDFTGMVPCGGIKMVHDCISDEDYNRIRQEIIAQLLILEDPKNATKIVKWACLREDLYEGPYLNSYPDIVFELEEKYGINWNVNTGLVEKNYTHNIISGGHKGDAFFVLMGEGQGKFKSDITSVDIAPIILNILNVCPQMHFDGSYILKN